MYNMNTTCADRTEDGKSKLWAIVNRLGRNVIPGAHAPHYSKNEQGDSGANYFVALLPLSTSISDAVKHQSLGQIAKHRGIAEDYKKATGKWYLRSLYDDLGTYAMTAVGFVGAASGSERMFDSVEGFFTTSLSLILCATGYYNRVSLLADASQQRIERGLALDKIVTKNYR